MVLGETAQGVEPGASSGVDFNITDLHCRLCAVSLEEAIRRCDGILAATLDPISGHSHVRYDPAILSARDVKEAVRGAGFAITPDS